MWGISFMERVSKYTQGNLIGYKQNDKWRPKEAHVEHFQHVTSPVSLYLGQLEHRLGYIPMWVDNTIEDFRVFRSAVINGNSYLPDTSLQFSQPLTRSILENEPVGTNLGSVIVASNSIAGNIITYSLDDDVTDFEIDENSGQLKSAIIFDYELNNAYIVVVTATDSYSNTASVSIRISISDVYEFSIVTRTQQVQDAIVNAISGVNNVADVTEDHFETILYLDLNNKGITTLKSDDFQGLTSLQRLVLSNNGLQALPDGIFTGLTSIKRIDLDNNKFQTLPHDIFTGLISLQHIELNNNKLKTLPDDIFTGLTSLKHLTLSNNNKLKTLPDGIFNGLTSLETIGLHHIKLESLSGDVFNGLSSLEQIYLHNNKLESLGR